jgi:hypothetical protein
MWLKPLTVFSRVWSRHVWARSRSNQCVMGWVWPLEVALWLRSSLSQNEEQLNRGSIVQPTEVLQLRSNLDITDPKSFCKSAKLQASRVLVACGSLHHLSETPFNLISDKIANGFFKSYRTFRPSNNKFEDTFLSNTTRSLGVASFQFDSISLASSSVNLSRTRTSAWVLR